MPKVKIDDISIYYEIHGQGNPVVLVGGLGNSGLLFHYQVPDFSKEFKAIVMDNRGAGRSDKPDVPYPIPLMVQDTVGLLDALNIGKAHVVGFSLGGTIAQEMAILFPDRLISVVIMATGPGR